jgi:hypothetical protein
MGLFLKNEVLGVEMGRSVLLPLFVGEGNMDSIKGVTVKESEKSRGLVSPARRALKKLTLAQFWPEKAHIRPVPKTGD